MPPRLARLLAAVVAIALVAGAIAVRMALTDDDDGGRGVVTAGGSGAAPPGRQPTMVRLACDDDVGEDVCAAVAAAVDPTVTVETEVLPAGELIEEATGEAAPEWDAWLTLDGLPGVLDVARGVAELPPLTAGGVAVASSPLALLALAEAPGGCDDDPAVAWTCLIEPPEEVRPAIAVPAPDTALGTLAIAAATTALTGDTDYGREILDTPVADRLRDLLRASPPAAGTTTVAQTEAMFRPGTASAAVTARGLADLQADRVRGRDRGLRAVPLEPGTVVGVTLVGLGTEGDAAVAVLREGLTDQTVGDALTDAGWTGGAGATTGLPEGDVIYALREELGR